MLERLRTALARYRASDFFRPRTDDLAAALIVSQRQGLAAERKCFNLERRLDLRIFLDIQRRKQAEELQAQVRHWIERTEQAEAVTKAAMDDRDEAINRAIYLEGELADMTRSRDDLIGIADKLRAAVEEGRHRVRSRR